MAKPHGHCDGFSCDECNAADDEAMRAEENTAATFAALVEVARAAKEFHKANSKWRQWKIIENAGGEVKSSEGFELLNQLARTEGALVIHLSALNPKLLEDGR